METEKTTKTIEQYNRENIVLKHYLKEAREKNIIINKNLKSKSKELEEVRERFKTVNNQLKRLKKETDFDIAHLKDALNNFNDRNKRLYRRMWIFDKILTSEDGFRISNHTVLLSFEYMLFYQKLFEMFVFDYIVDRQDPDNKTDEDTGELIKDCKQWTTEIIANQIYNTNFNPKVFMQKFRNFVSKYTENVRFT